MYILNVIRAFSRLTNNFDLINVISTSLELTNVSSKLLHENTK